MEKEKIKFLLKNIESIFGIESILNKNGIKARCADYAGSYIIRLDDNNVICSNKYAEDTDEKINDFFSFSKLNSEVLKNGNRRIY